MLLREERPEDRAAISALHRRSFAGGLEAALVERLRSDGLVTVSLLAVRDETMLGHILFSRLAVEVDGRRVVADSLAPMAVAPEHQRQGIGSALVRHGLVLAGDRGAQAAVVLGHVGFYPRFGFSAELARKLASPFPGEAFMAIELLPGALAGLRGSVTYPAAFGLAP